MKKILEQSGKIQGILSEEKSGNPVIIYNHSYFVVTRFKPGSDQQYWPHCSRSLHNLNFTEGTQRGHTPCRWPSQTNHAAKRAHSQFIITDRIRRMREGNVFSLSTPVCVCVCVCEGGLPRPGPDWGGVPQPGTEGGTTLSQVQPRVYPTLGTPLSDLAEGTPAGDGYPTSGTPHQTWLGYPFWGVPHIGSPIRPGWGVPHLRYPHPITPGWGVPHLGYPPSDLVGGYPCWGYRTLGTSLRPVQGVALPREGVPQLS